MKIRFIHCCLPKFSQQISNDNNGKIKIFGSLHAVDVAVNNPKKNICFASATPNFSVIVTILIRHKIVVLSLLYCPNVIGATRINANARKCKFDILSFFPKKEKYGMQTAITHNMQPKYLNGNMLSPTTYLQQ